VYRFSVSNSVETWINKLKDKKLFLASGFDLLCKHDSAPVEFNFNDLSELFTDLVGFKSDDDDEEQSDEKPHKKPNKKPISPKVKLGIDCAICMEDVGNKGVYNLSCGHLFHNGCLDQWLLNNNTCPMCRHEFPKEISRATPSDTTPVGELIYHNLHNPNSLENTITNLIEEYINEINGLTTEDDDLQRAIELSLNDIS
jgi:hypothetical protein